MLVLEKQIQQILAAFDFFIHSDIFDHRDLLSRARILSMMLIGGSTTYAIACLVLIHMREPPTNFPIYFSIAIGNLIIALFALQRLKRVGNYPFCCAITLAQSFITIIGVTYISGGPYQSPVIQFFSVPCLAAFFLGGTRWGVVAIATSLCCVGFMAVIQSQGFEFPQIVLPYVSPYLQAMLLPVNLIFMVLMALAYEITYISLKKQLDYEHDKFLRLAAVDSLTGLANRRMFDETLACRIEVCRKLIPMRRFALCYLDLNRFKPINDKFGHDVGDTVLNAVSVRLRSALRGADFLGRHGGDEFIMLLDSVHDAAEAEALSKRFLRLIQEPIETTAGLMHVGGSFGFAFFPDHGENASSLLKAADDAMYESKRVGDGFRIAAK